LSLKWRYETSSIFDDPTDVPDRRWKVIAQKIAGVCEDANCESVNHSFDDKSYLAVRYANSPDGEWSSEECLFGTLSACQTNINSLHASLNETGRTLVSLPVDFRYADVFPYKDDSGNTRIVVSAEKGNIHCVQ
jgi:hypothetical protein